MEKKKDYRVNDICFYDRETNKLIVVPFHEWTVRPYPSSGFFPIGIVVIPSSHDVYGTGQCGVMSLKEMNYITPDEGSTSYQGMCWGQYCAETPLPKLNVGVVTGTTDSPTIEANDILKYHFLPSDIFSGTQCPTDSLVRYSNSDSSYPAAPSPYLEDGSRNPVYYQTESPSSLLNCLADFDGVGNTKTLCDLATSQPKWKTDDIIINTSFIGYSPAACCCWRFHTEGTKQGDWYLPAEGELGYIMVRLRDINDTIETLINVYGDDVGVLLNTFNGYWSSSEHSTYCARCIGITYGCLGGIGKSEGGLVRAFLRV